jgi:hypothetical protein
MESEDRLSTRDIASPGGHDTAGERDATLADAPPADTAAVPPERADRDYDEGGAVAAGRAGEGDVVTDEPNAGCGPSREAIADPAASGTSAAGADERLAPAAAAAQTGTGDGDAAPLLADAEGFQARWEEIQVRFVDEPRRAVEDADALVATVMQRLAEGFARERERLESQWGRGEDISTEDLRVALQRYRSFFRRLLST